MMSSENTALDQYERCIQGVCKNANMNCELRLSFAQEKALTQLQRRRKKKIKK